MSAISVAKKDFKDTRRTRTLWLVVGILTLLGGLMAYVFGGTNILLTDRMFKSLFRDVVMAMSIIVPIVAIIATYLAIAGERDSGSIKFMLSLPNTRRDVFVGKALSRSLTVAGALGVTFLVVTVILAVRTESLPVGYVLGVTAILLAYALSFVSITVAVSSAVKSRSRAIAGAVGTYFVMVVLYIFPIGSVRDIARWLHHDLLGLAENPDLYDLVTHTSPFFAFQQGLNLVLPDSLRTFPFRRRRIDARGPDAQEAVQAIDLPFYLTSEFSLVILAFWIVVPLVIGYWRFERADLT